MTWLSGKPSRVLSLLWPENDPAIQQTSSYQNIGCCSVSDDQILRALTVRKPNEQYSVVYLAKIYDGLASGETIVPFVRLATLSYAVHGIALLPNRVGFVSLVFDVHTTSLALRIHRWDGTISKEKSVPAAAAYGELVVSRHAVAVCVSSGQPAPAEMCLAGSPDVHRRVDAYDGSTILKSRDLTGDQIWVWNIQSDSLICVKIPQDDFAPLTHQASFRFVGRSHIVLGGNVIASFGRPSALLKSFDINDPDGYSRTFTHGDNFEMDDDIGVVAKPGSFDGNDDIVANYHHRGCRLTVIKNGLLVGDVDSEPTSEDPEGLRAFWAHPQMSRTIEGTISKSLPSISDNRLLVALRIEDNEAYEKFAIKAPHEPYPTILFLYDFDETRCKDLCNLSSVGRTTLESRLREENPNVQVSIVERNFSVTIEEEEDREWPDAEQEPEPDAWTAHVQELYEIGEQRKDGTAETPLLDFDEAPASRKAIPRILFTKSAVWLPEDADIRGIYPGNLALTTSGIVHLPDVGKEGHFFFFGNA